jgi:hypothetical protein
MATALKVKLTGGGEAVFNPDPIGEGGEKAVFLTQDGQHVVCFFLQNLSDRFERVRRLEKILGSYNPTSGTKGSYWQGHFCWPTAWVDGDGALPRAFLARHRLLDPPLGVVAPVYRKNFFFRDVTGSKREKNGKWFTSEKPRRMLPPDERGNFLTYLQVCTKMARAVCRMHYAGLAHSDLSNKNVLIDPRGGDACIIDIDSLVVPGLAPPSVLGTPGYIAPEVLAGKGSPCIETDRHALAVLVYETLLLRHPLRGPKVYSTVSAEEDEVLSLGAKAMYIENPKDRSNALRPPPAISVSRLGPYLEELFRRAFVDGLHAPGLRPLADDWERGLYRTFDLIHPSPGGKEWFVLAPGMPLSCPFTGKRLTQPVPYAVFHNEVKPGHFVSDRHTLTIYQHLQLMRWHLIAKTSPRDDPDRTRQGYFAFHNSRWYLVNESGETMQVVNGPAVPHGQSVEITAGLALRLSAKANGRLLAFDFLRP